MHLTEQLKHEIRVPAPAPLAAYYFQAKGYEAAGLPDTPCSDNERVAAGIEAMFTLPIPHIYQSDLIVGSIRPLCIPVSEEEQAHANALLSPYPFRWLNSDHYAPDYWTVLEVGVPGLIDRIDASMQTHANEPDRVDYLRAMRRTMCALQTRLSLHARRAEELMGADGYDCERLQYIKTNCDNLASDAPRTFAEALQLVWMIHSCFLYEARYAMALGRMDQFLYPFYANDIAEGRLTQEDAILLLENVFMKIHERYVMKNEDDVVNICIGGVRPEDGECALNDLSYAILRAVGNVNLPGPNLSLRVTPDTPDWFLDECLKIIGTGLGYPALMNNDVNMAALRRYGYEETDIRNYCMVGCIENFMSGSQPPWTDGRFDTPRFLEYIFFHGKGLWEVGHGLDTGDVSEITSMEEFMDRYETQLRAGVAQYMEDYYRWHICPNPEKTPMPFLSCFCRACIGRGLDINMGGAKYPSAHGAALMGVGTTSDSLAAIEKVVFVDHAATLTEIGEAMKANFEGYDDLRELLIAAPKYGNNDEFVDKYARWFLSFLTEEFRKYRSHDGGCIYTIMAANVNNIWAGMNIGATPDGRLARQPLSDAASPTYGRDTRGATATILSVSKPDYTLSACGTVVNQKFHPSMFEDGKRDKLLALIRVYFSRGGQEIQINATSPEVLRDAMEHPEKYPELIVRVSGFSARFVTLARDVQMDILARTQQE